MFDKVSDDDLMLVWRQTGNPKMRDELVRRHVYIAKAVAKRFLGSGEPYDDLVQEASIAVIKGIDGFDLTVGSKISTYVTRKVTGSVMHYLRDRVYAIKQPGWLHERRRKVQKAYDGLVKQFGRKPTDEEVANHANLSEKDVEIVQSTEHVFDPVYFDDMVLNSDGELVSGEDITAEMSENPYNGLDDVIVSMEIFGQFLSSANPNERAVMTLFLNGYYQSDIANHLGISGSYVCSIVRKCSAKLRNKGAYHDVRDGVALGIVENKIGNESVTGQGERFLNVTSQYDDMTGVGLIAEERLSVHDISEMFGVPEETLLRLSADATFSNYADGDESYFDAREVGEYLIENNGTDVVGRLTDDICGKIRTYLSDDGNGSDDTRLEVSPVGNFAGTIADIPEADVDVPADMVYSMDLADDLNLDSTEKNAFRAAISRGSVKNYGVEVGVYRRGKLVSRLDAMEYLNNTSWFKGASADDGLLEGSDASPEYLSTKDAAEFSGYSRNGLIHAVRVGRITVHKNVDGINGNAYLVTDLEELRDSKGHQMAGPKRGNKSNDGPSESKCSVEFPDDPRNLIDVADFIEEDYRKVLGWARAGRIKEYKVGERKFYSLGEVDVMARDEGVGKYETDIVETDTELPDVMVDDEEAVVGLEDGEQCSDLGEGDEICDEQVADSDIGIIEDYIIRNPEKLGVYLAEVDGGGLCDDRLGLLVYGDRDVVSGLVDASTDRRMLFDLIDCQDAEKKSLDEE